MRTHMDVQEGYRPRRPTVKASGTPQAAGQFGGPPEAGPVERYAPGMGYPGDEGGGPPGSRLDRPAGRGGRQGESTRSGSHRRPVGDSRPGSAEYPAALGYPGTPGPAGCPGHPGPAGLPRATRAPRAPRPDRATRRLPRERQAIRPVLRNRGRGTRPGGGGVIGPGMLTTAAPPSGRPRRRPQPRALPRRARTPGAARTGARVRRSRGDPRARRPAPPPRPADRCGAPELSAPQGRADAAQSADSRPRPVRPTRYTRRASSRPGTRPRSAPSLPQGGPGPQPDPAQTPPSPSTRCWR